MLQTILQLLEDLHMIILAATAPPILPLLLRASELDARLTASVLLLTPHHMPSSSGSFLGPLPSSDERFSAINLRASRKQRHSHSLDDESFKAADENPMFLFTAAADGDAEALRSVLLRAPAAFVNTRRPDDGSTVVHVAAGKGFEECLKILVAAGADLDGQDDQGNTPCFVAAREGHIDCLKRLIAAEADISLENAQGMTPLFRACESGHDECVGVLIDAGADKNAFDKQGRTPTLVAAQLDHPGCILQMLLRPEPTDLRSPNKNGRSPLMVARLMRNHASAAVLALATLEFDDEEDAVVPARGLAVEEPDPRKPIAGLAGSIPELLCTVGGESILTTCLPYAFSRRPLDTCFAVVALVEAYRKQALSVMATDEKGGDALLDAAYVVQLSLTCMLDQLNQMEFTVSACQRNESRYMHAMHAMHAMHPQGPHTLGPFAFP
jgi:hypothetical protein